MRAPFLRRRLSLIWVEAGGHIIVTGEIAMADVRIEAEVSGPDFPGFGQVYWWKGMSADSMAKLEKFDQRIMQYLDKASSNKDPGGLSATFKKTVDGQVFERKVDGFSEKELSKFQRFFHSLESEVISMGEERADRKAKERHGQGKGGKK